MWFCRVCSPWQVQPGLGGRVQRPALAQPWRTKHADNHHHGTGLSHSAPLPCPGQASPRRGGKAWCLQDPFPLLERPWGPGSATDPAPPGTRLETSSQLSPAVLCPGSCPPSAQGLSAPVKPWLLVKPWMDSGACSLDGPSKARGGQQAAPSTWEQPRGSRRQEPGRGGAGCRQTLPDRLLRLV